MHHRTSPDGYPALPAQGIWRLFWVGCLGMLVLASGVDAKTKKLDKESLKIAVTLAKDREAAFSREEAMSTEAFQAQWSELAARLDELYGGHKVRLGKFGVDVGYRKGFTHLLYNGLKVQNRVGSLSPSPQKLIAKHPFLQMLVLEGSCYTGGDPFPKKMRDLLKASPEMQFLVRDHLADWESKHRKEFNKRFPPPSSAKASGGR